MPRAISIETSGRIGSIAVVDDGNVLTEEQFPHGLQHAAQIIPIIGRLTDSVAWKPKDVDELYISAGPGSFTGLRIAVTLGKTLAMATGVKLVAVPTVQALALNAPSEARHLIIVLDAKRDQIFTARFAGGAEVEPAHLDTLAGMLSRAPRPVHLLGEGIPYHQKFISTNDSNVIICPPESWRARAAAVAQIGSELARAGQFANPLTLTPIYIRKPEAEEKFESRTAQR